MFTNCSKDKGGDIKDDDDTVIIIDDVIKVPIEFAIDSIQEFTQVLSGEAERNRLQHDWTYSDFTPTGVYVETSKTINLNIELIEGTSLPKLLIGTYSRDDHWNFKPEIVNLTEGANNIRASKGGLLYIKYTSETNPNSKVKISFNSGWKHSPIYIKGETTNQLWKDKLTYFEGIPDVTLIGDNAFLVISRDKAIEYQNQDQDEVLNSIDEVITAENDISGLDSSSALHMPNIHKIMMVEYTGDAYYMFAYNYRTAFNNSGLEYLLNPNSFNTEGWGPWHELGHMHQVDAWTWNKVVEATVNIYSSAALRSRGITSSWMNTKNKWPKIDTYLSLPEEEKDYNSDSLGYFGKYGMFHQLRLAFGDDFYKKLHKITREEKPEIYNNEDKMRYFMLKSCEASGKDLTDFFKKWGLKYTGVEAVYNEISELGLTAPDSDLTTLRD